LHLAPGAERRDRGRRQRHDAGTGFRLGAVAAGGVADERRALVEVDLGPGQAEEFVAAHAGVHRHDEQHGEPLTGLVKIVGERSRVGGHPHHRRNGAQVLRRPQCLSLDRCQHAVFAVGGCFGGGGSPAQLVTEPGLPGRRPHQRLGLVDSQEHHAVERVDQKLGRYRVVERRADHREPALDPCG
jgi:hypothetical protein